MRLRSLFFLTLLFLPARAWLQATCTTLGQSPQTAFPVCGTSTFSQTNVPTCGGRTIPGPCGGIADVNPFYYRFTCFTAGTLGFTITPQQASDDYDWQVFDITGRNANDIYTDASLFVVCNWSGNTGTTGTSSTVSGLAQCAGTGFPTFSGMPALIAGHEYLLLVSNFSASQKGYDLKFTGGTAVITDPVLPAVAGAKIDCGATEITIGFNKRMRCSTIAANGSDFALSPSGTIVSAAGVSCSSSFDFDSVRLTLSAPLPPGNYTITLKAGSDGNTIADNCNTEILAGSTTTFTVLPQAAVAMGTITPPACTPSSLVLNFTEPIRCTSIAGNGSDFLITGAGAVTVTGATATCNALGFTTAITIQTSGPILTPGNYQVVLQQGSDGNTLLGDCNRQVNAGQSAAFVITPQLPLAMGTIPAPSCSPSVITLDLAEKIFCSTIAADGSDFVITGPTAVTITGATANCDANGQSSSISIQLSGPLAVTGTYQLRVASGTDGNTLIGECSRTLPAGQAASFDIPDAPFTPMGIITTPGCSPATLQLTLPALIRCSSLAADGSDFRLTGPAPITITGATGNCNTSGLTQTITLQLSTAIAVGGNYNVQLVTGTDGNTILSDCYRQTPAGAITGFSAVDTVSAEFQVAVSYDCLQNEAEFTHDGAHGVTSWNWTVNGTPAGSQPQLVKTFSSESQNEIKLTVSNGVCTDTYAQPLIFSNKITAAFEIPDMACPGDKVEIINKSTGPIDNWNWSFGSTAAPSSLQTPPVIIYPLTGVDQYYTIVLRVSNNNGCETSRAEQVKILGSCVIGVPSAFTPNNDGKNDYFYPLNAFKADQLNFRIYNRWGQLVFHSTEWTKRWDGSINGIPQATGTYVWMLEYVHKDTRERVAQKGTVTLIR
jgi:gliding motility-associated-like protein